MKARGKVIPDILKIPTIVFTIPQIKTESCPMHEIFG
jgi:hypothetical protein